MLLPQHANQVLRQKELLALAQVTCVSLLDNSPAGLDVTIEGATGSTVRDRVTVLTSMVTPPSVTRAGAERRKHPACWEGSAQLPSHNR